MINTPDYTDYYVLCYQRAALAPPPPFAAKVVRDVGMCWVLKTVHGNEIRVNKAACSSKPEKNPIRLKNDDPR